MLKIWQWFKRLFSRSARFIKQYISPAIKVVEAIKLFIDSPATPFVTALIPGTVDDLVAAKLKAVLPTVLQSMKLTDRIADMTDPNEILREAVKFFQDLHPDARKGYYLTIASMLTEALADGKLSWAEVVQLVQYTYTEKFSKTK